MTLNNVRTENDITGEVAKALRKRSGMPQHSFWGAVGVIQSVGCSYEGGQRAKRIPAAVRTLLFARYVAGLPIDATSKEGVKQLRSLAKLCAQTSDTKGV